ncbi:MAG: SDR family NAD(P)-dependent oxidoreductase [Deltaproteobacteria bacterium]|nr:SDR family NAD(P)-dependent oxidoreductase [Deltaproteobacteria bacterium]
MTMLRGTAGAVVDAGAGPREVFPMADELRFDGRVALVTGAGNGLGRMHALLLGRRGCKVLVNDLGGSAFGEGKGTSAADKVVEEIRAAGGEAAANYDSVEDGDKIVKAALDAFGRLDIVINNAGILRDTSFQKMSEADWDLIYRVHVKGAFKVTHAAWNHLRDAGYGRVLFTASAAGIYGNFGQANYSMAKLGLVGLANTLALEGKKRGVLVNTIAPIAGSRLTETVLPRELIDALRPEFVSPLVAYLCHESCTETGGLYEVGGGFLAKLRWERAEGHAFKLSRTLTPEQVAEHFGEVTDFSRATHPQTINESMEPILGNLGSAKSRGGNEFIDVDEALAAPPLEARNAYDERDVALYALGVGAAQDPLNDEDLKLVYELHGDGQRALPTYGVIPALNAVMDLARRGVVAPGLKYGFERILHGEQYLELPAPLPLKAKLSHSIRVKDIFDKGKNALVVTEITSTDEEGVVVARNEFTAFIRGVGGFGGDRGPSDPGNHPPERAPDATITEKTSANQALLYRLSGDWNPLHADPSFASAFGFPKPILHGLCTFGYAVRHAINGLLGGDPRRFKSVKVRFAETVFPGETLVTQIWRESPTRAVFVTRVLERDKVVLSNAAVEFYDAIPTRKAPAAPVASAPSPTGTSVSAPAQAPAPAPAAPSGEPSSGQIFWAIRYHLERHPDLVKKVGNTFQFRLTGPGSAWYLDLKNGAGALTEGEGPSPDVTLEIADGDFVAMSTGKVKAQKLYFSGKLKITGNVMASQKLEFLQTMDTKAAAEAYAKAHGGAVATPAPAPAPAPAAPAAPARASRAAELLEAAVGRLAKTGAGGEIGAVLQFRVRNPEADLVLDLTGAPALRTGREPAATTLVLDEDDLVGLLEGREEPQALFMNGKLRVEGVLRHAHRLGVLRQG